MLLLMRMRMSCSRSCACSIDAEESLGLCGADEMAAVLRLSVKGRVPSTGRREVAGSQRLPAMKAE